MERGGDTGFTYASVDPDMKDRRGEIEMNEQQQQPPQVVYYVPQPQAPSTTDNFFSIVAILFALCFAIPVAGVALLVALLFAMDGLAGFIVGIPIALVGLGLAWLIMYAAWKL